MAERPRRAPPRDKPTRHDQLLLDLNARAPTTDEAAALRALVRGRATEGQQKLAMAYVLAELCGVGSVPFAKEHSYGTAFRSGSLGVGIAIGAIAGAVVMRFPDREASDE